MGKELVELVLEETGLPDDLIRAEFQHLLHKNGKSMEALTLDDLREVLADYLQDVMLDVKRGPLC